MPLVGIVDPSHEEYEARIEGRLPRWWTVEETLAYSKLQGPKWSPWPYEVLRGMMEEHQERDYISVTMLTGGCSRSKVLERKEDYIEVPDRFYQAFRGTMIHATLEQYAREGAFAETRFFTDIEGHSLSASPDLVTLEGDLYDYKFTDNPPMNHYPWRNHTLQVQYSAYVARHAYMLLRPDRVEEPAVNVPHIKTATLVYLGPKGPKPITVERKQDVVLTKGANAGKVIQRKRPYIWTDDEVLSGDKTRGHEGEPGLVDRLLATKLALDIYPELPDEVLDVWDWNVPRNKRNRSYVCNGKPFCHLDCLAKRYPNGLTWPRQGG